jgi:hypothetical protein
MADAFRHSHGLRTEGIVGPKMTSDLIISEFPHGRTVHRALGLAVLLGAASLAVYSVFFFSRLPLESLLRDWSADDAFYYFQTARNLAQKGIPAFDGINITNGFHALWFLLLCVLYKFPVDPVQAIYLITGLQVLMALASFGCILLLMRMLRVTWFFSLFAIPYLIKYKTLYVGLEAGTSLLVLCGSLVFCVFLLKDPNRLRRRSNIVIFSAFLFLAPLARLENALFSASMIGLIVLFRIRSGERISLGDLVAVVAPFALLMVFYFSANYLIFGAPVPVSGLVKYWWHQSQDANQPALALAWKNFQLLWQMRIVSHGLLWGVIALAAIAFSWLFAAYRSKERNLDHIFDGIIVALFVFHFAKTITYAAAGSEDAITADWYHVSGPLLSWMSMAFLGDRFFLLVLKMGEHTLGGGFARKCSICLFVAGICIASLTGKIVYDTMMLYSTQSASSQVDWRIASYRMAQWLNRNLADTPRVGVFDSGIVGYFSDMPIVNLDGLINSVEYLQTLKSGKLEEYLARNNIRYVANAVTDDEAKSFSRYVSQRTGQKLPLKGRFELIYQDQENSFSWAGVQRYRLYRYNPPMSQPSW